MPPIDPLGAADRAAGEALERLQTAHHERRLKKIGRSAQRNPPDDGSLWAAGDPPPRAGNELDVLIDGSEYFSALEHAIRNANHRVVIAGWMITPEFALTRGEPPVLMRDLLAEAAESVDLRVLLWAGAPVPVSSQGRAAVRDTRDALARGTKIKAELDSNERPMHCHHEKLVVIDDEIAFVGGIDATAQSGDRYDTPEHPARGRMGWHDVATRFRGPAVADVADHIAQRWHAITGEVLDSTAAPSSSADGVELQIVRTLPEKIYDFAPRGDFRIIETYLRALRSAQTFVYLENQYLWSPEVVNLLADKLRNPPSDEFRLLLLLPGKPNTGQDDTRGQIATLLDADRGQGRFLATTIRARSANSNDHIYVHAKVGIVDDHWLSIGSANLNAHSFYNDTEVNVVTCDPALARDTRLRLWAEHLERSPGEIDGAPSAVIDELWRPIAAEQRDRLSRDEPLTHRLVQMKPESRRTARLIGPMQELFVDG